MVNPTADPSFDPAAFRTSLLSLLPPEINAPVLTPGTWVWVTVKSIYSTTGEACSFLQQFVGYTTNYWPVFETTPTSFVTKNPNPLIHTFTPVDLQ
jgi:hypothetical protein